MSNNHSVAKSPGGFHVANLARRTGVTPSTIRYYVRKGLLKPERNAKNGYRCFSAADLHRLVFIRRSQTLGLTIKEIQTILEIIDDGEVPYHEIKSMVQECLETTKERIVELQATEARITRTLEVWQQMGEPDPHEDELCPLIERLAVTDDVASAL